MVRKLSLCFASLLFAFSLHAQSSTPTTPSTPTGLSTFALTATPVALPGNHQTVAGTIAGLTFTPTQNFDLREDNILVPGQNFQGYFGGFNYRLPAISTAVNNVSPNLNGYRFQFYLTASMGVDRITPPNENTAQHYAFLAGGGVNYMLTSGGMWTLGVEIRYAKFPGLANNTAIVSLGPSIHF